MRYLEYKDCLRIEKVDRKAYGLSTGQINDAFQNALHRSPTGDEIRQFSSDPNLNGSPGQQQLIASLGGNPGGGGGYGSTGSSPADDILKQTITQYVTDLQANENRYNQYTKDNPFVFDDVLAADTAKARTNLDPYYTQTLGDFLTGINIKRTRSLEDERNLLGQLQQGADRYVDQSAGALEGKNLATSSQYDINGLGDSGLSARTIGQNTNENNNNVQNFLVPNQFQQNQAILNTNRLVNQDLPLATNIEARNLQQDEINTANAQGTTAANNDQQKYYQNAALAAGLPAGSPSGTTATSSFLNSVGQILG